MAVLLYDEFGKSSLCIFTVMDWIMRTKKFFFYYLGIAIAVHRLYNGTDWL